MVDNRKHSVRAYALGVTPLELKTALNPIHIIDHLCYTQQSTMRNPKVGMVPVVGLGREQAIGYKIEQDKRSPRLRIGVRATFAECTLVVLDQQRTVHSVVIPKIADAWIGNALKEYE